MGATWTFEELRVFADAAEHGRVVAFDTETTGGPDSGEVLQIGAAEYVAGVLSRTMDVYLRPSCPIDPLAEAVHHISQAFAEEHGVAPSEGVDAFAEFLGDADLLVGHNLPFDLRMMAVECGKFGLAHDFSRYATCDTLLLARRLLPGLRSHRLDTLVKALGLQSQNTHNALDDARACGELFLDLARRIPMTESDCTYEPVFDA